MTPTPPASERRVPDSVYTRTLKAYIEILHAAPDETSFRAALEVCWREAMQRASTVAFEMARGGCCEAIAAAIRKEGGVE